ncbi:hypothetical protein ACIGHB_23125 [Streptomyces sp. NPDC085460]|uniref:hypothetical protein n=1 Tax=Streptomyces sp. NPDC085460 TaxID=3365723 RepID=UPI0037D781CC
MSALPTPLRQLLRVRRSPSVTGVQFCDSCAEVTDPAARAAARRHSQQAALSLHSVRI